MARREIETRAKASIDADDSFTRREYLPMQGQMSRDNTMTGDFIWAVSNLTWEAMKFALNSATDTLPQNTAISLGGIKVYILAYASSVEVDKRYSMF